MSQLEPHCITRIPLQLSEQTQGTDICMLYQAVTKQMQALRPITQKI